MSLTEEHREHIRKRGFSDEQIDQLHADGIIRSLDAKEIQADWLKAFPRMKGNKGGAILLTFNSETNSLWPDTPPLDEKGNPDKYLYQFGGDDPKGTHTQPWNPPEAIAATEGLFDALVATYLIGIPCSAATAPSHIGRSEFAASVRCYFSDADVPFHHNHSLLPMVVRLCREKGLKLAHLPHNPKANYAYSTEKIPNECKWGAEEWHLEWLRLGCDPKAELQKIIDGASQPVQYLQAVFQDFEAAGLRYPQHGNILRNGAAAIADATDSEVERQLLRDRLADSSKAPKKWVDQLIRQRTNNWLKSQQPSAEEQEQLKREKDDQHRDWIKRRGHEQPFDVLGWNKERNRIHYRARETGQVAAIKLGGLSDLIPATGKDWLEFFRDARGNPDLLDIQGELCRQADAVGVFDDKRRVGRGAFIDQGRVVFHLGDKLEVDGVITEIRDIESRYVYELLEPLDFDPAVEPLSDAESQEILQISKDCGWSRPADHLILLAGLFRLRYVESSPSGHHYKSERVTAKGRATGWTTSFDRCWPGWKWSVLAAARPSSVKNLAKTGGLSSSTNLSKARIVLKVAVGATTCCLPATPSMELVSAEAAKAESQSGMRSTPRFVWLASMPKFLSHQPRVVSLN